VCLRFDHTCLPLNLLSFYFLLSFSPHCMQIYPTSGPQKSFSSIELSGCGFWNSSSIVVRFMKKGDDTALPRSSHGALLRDGVVTCRPPKLNDIGLYEVMVAFNGQDFCSEAMEVNIYTDPVLNSLVSPLLLDIRAEHDSRIDIALVPLSIVYHLEYLLTKLFFCSLWCRAAQS
jgi:hypothetical protein